MHFFLEDGLRSGFFVVPLVVSFWLRIFEIFIESIQDVIIPKYFKNLQPKKGQKEEPQKAATKAGVMKEMQKGTN